MGGAGDHTPSYLYIGMGVYFERLCGCKPVRLLGVVMGKKERPKGSKPPLRSQST